MAANILLVEDEPGIQELLKFNLAQAGHQVTATGDAEHALAFLKNTLPDVILLDWMLPGMSASTCAAVCAATSATSRFPSSC